jgi:hypothetical protein
MVRITRLISETILESIKLQQEAIDLAVKDLALFIYT